MSVRSTYMATRPLVGKAYHIPLFGYALRLVVAFAKLPRIAFHLARLDQGARVDRRLLDSVAEAMPARDAVLQRLEVKADALQQRLESETHALQQRLDDVNASLSRLDVVAEALPTLVEAFTSSQTAIRLLRRDRATQSVAEAAPAPGIEAWRAWIDPQIELVPERQLRREAPTTLNRTPRLSDWSVGGRLAHWMTELRQPHVVHRKMWEYAICMEGMERFGVVTPEAVALAVGAGSEAPLFYYANTIKRMVATDLYDNPLHEGTPVMLTSPASFAPFLYREDRLEVLSMRGDELHFEDDVFDFAFCLSSIEHFGSRETQARAFSEMGRVVRPGGMVCITTELVLNGEKHKEYFAPSEICKMFLEHSSLKLEGSIDMRVSDALPSLAVDIRVPADLLVTPHLLLTDGRVLWTSLSMFFRKT